MIYCSFVKSKREKGAIVLQAGGSKETTRTLFKAFRKKIMGLSLCKKHGQQSIYNLCPHMYKQFKSGELSGKNFILKRDEIGSAIYMCESCIQKYGLQDTKLLDYDDIQNLDDNFGASCYKCVDELIKINKGGQKTVKGPLPTKM